MSQKLLEAHYRPNRLLTEAHGLDGYNCGFAAARQAGAFGEHQRALVWRLIGEVPIDEATRVLDVGSGIGGPAQWIAQRHGARVVGLEYCGSSVRAARQRAESGAERLRFVQGDAQYMPLAADSVDVIFNLESALHYADKDGFLGECRRVLRPGGWLCLGDLTTDYRRLFAVAQLFNKVPSQFNSNVRLWSRDAYRRAFATQRLSIEQSERVTTQVADSLADGLADIRLRGWKASRGFRARYFYLAFLEKLLRRGKLHYDLFRVRKDGGPGNTARGS
jgi:ubiquinone/menaquinone biosynthesis C-methylase UbiE